MRGGWLGIVLVLSSGCEGGSVEVTYVAGLDPPMRIEGALVASDSSSLTTTTDSEGHAVLAGVASGATVYVTIGSADTTNGGSRFITAITGVEPGDELWIGPTLPPVPIDRGEMTVLFSPPPVAYEYLNVMSRCGRNNETGASSARIMFDSRCTGDVEVVVQAMQSAVGVVYYAYATFPFTPESAFTIDASAWRAPDAINVAFVGALEIDNPYVMMRDETSRYQGWGNIEGITSGSLLLVGQQVAALVEGNIWGGGRQSFEKRFPPIAMQTLDVMTVYAPWLVLTPMPGSSSVHFTVDDAAGGLRPAQIIEANWAWPLPEANTNVTMRVLIDASTVNGQIDFPTLPPAIRPYGPAGSAELWRFVALRYDDGLTYADVHLRPDADVLTDPVITQRAFATGR